MPDMILPRSPWLDLSPGECRRTAILIGQCALGITGHDRRLARADLASEVTVNRGLMDALIHIGICEALDLAELEMQKAERLQKRKVRLAERRARAAQINDALEAKKAADRERQEKRVMKLLEGRALPVETTMPVPDYSGENVALPTGA